MCTNCSFVCLNAATLFHQVDFLVRILVTKFREAVLKDKIDTQNEDGNNQKAKQRSRVGAVQITHLFHHIIWRDVIRFVARFSLFPIEVTCDVGILEELSYVLKNLHASQEDSLLCFRAARGVLGKGYLPRVKDEEFLKQDKVICIAFAYYSAMLVQRAESGDKLLSHQLKERPNGQKLFPRGGYVREDGGEMVDSFGWLGITPLVPTLYQIGGTLYGRSSIDCDSFHLRSGLDFRASTAAKLIVAINVQRLRRGQQVRRKCSYFILLLFVRS